MIAAQMNKWVSLFKPHSVATNGTGSGTVSCVGFKYAQVLLVIDTAANATNTDATVKVEEGDGTTFATHADLAMTTGTPNTSDVQCYMWRIDLRKRKKNLKLSYTPGTAARIAQGAVLLSNAEEMPNSAAEAGAAAGLVTC